MRSRDSRLHVAVGVTALLLSVLTSGCKVEGTPTAQQTTPSVTVARVRSGDIVRSVDLLGTVRAYQEVTLYSRVAGYLESIAVDKGDRVSRGQILAQVQVPELEADEVRCEARAEATRLESTRLSEAQAAAQDLVMPHAVDAARGEALVAQAELKRIQTLLGYTRITAPFSGVITRRWVDPGALVPAPTTGLAPEKAAVVSIADFSKVRIEVAVPEGEVPKVVHGLPVSVSSPGGTGQPVPGEISRIGYTLDPSTRTMPAEIELTNPEGAFRPGMFVSVRLSVESRPGALLIPAEALIMEKGKSFVFVASAGRVSRVPVVTGFDDGIKVEVLQGLTEGQQVVVAGRQSISDGQEVQAVEVE